MPSTVITSRFDPGAVYRINVDNDDDAQADVAFTFTFSELKRRASRDRVLRDRRPGPRGGPVGQVLATSIPVASMRW